MSQSIKNLTSDEIQAESFKLQCFLARWHSCDEAEDLIQSIWMKSLRHTNIDVLGAWLHHVARNDSITLLRKRQRFLAAIREKAFTARTCDEDVAAKSELQEIRIMVGEAVAKLPEEWRTVVVLAYCGDLTKKEICEVTGLSPGQVRYRLRKALDRLRASLSSLAPEPELDHGREGP